MTRRPSSPPRRRPETPMGGALFTAMALIAMGQVAPSATEGAQVPKLRSEAPQEDPFLKIERLLRTDDRHRRGG